MKYQVEFTEMAKKELKKLDRHISLMITSWIRKNLEGCENPRQYGRALVANHSGKWRYRIGDYRVLAAIQDEKITILIVTVGHRREVYEKH